LELLPRSGNASTSPSPLSSPKIGPPPPINPRGNPFGAARPVDVSPRDKEVAHRLEREEKIALSRSNSRTGTDRPPQTPPSLHSKPSSSTQTSGPTLAPTVRPSLSFANVAAKKESTALRTSEERRGSNDNEGQPTELDTKVVS